MRWWVIAFAAALAGCAGEPTRSLSPSAQDAQQAQRVLALDHWRADGRVAIQRGDEGWSATMRWQKQGGAFQLRLIAPLGRGTYQLAGDEAEVELIVPDGRRFTSSDPQSLMTEHLGWSIPVDGAQYWLRGVVAPGAPPSNIRRDEAGLLQDLHQSGWRISVLRRMRAGDFELPAKLYMHYRDLKVRIVISAWKLEPA